MDNDTQENHRELTEGILNKISCQIASLAPQALQFHMFTFFFANNNI